jgi:DNA mismatch endonuclease (patch repair protein)
MPEGHKTGREPTTPPLSGGRTPSIFRFRVNCVPYSRPRALSRVVSKAMRSMPTRDSGPEISLRQAIHRHGLRYALHAGDLPGRPDIVFRSAKVAVFVDGCFWHGCPRHAVLPRNNRSWWRRKITANRSRDRRNDRSLRAVNWLPMHVWEHCDMNVAAIRIAETVRRRRQMLAGR